MIFSKDQELIIRIESADSNAKKLALKIDLLERINQLQAEIKNRQDTINLLYGEINDIEYN